LTQRLTVSVAEVISFCLWITYVSFAEPKPPRVVWLSRKTRLVWGAGRFVLNQWDLKCENEILFIKQICDVVCAVYGKVTAYAAD